MKITTFNVLSPQYFRTHDTRTRKESNLDSSVWLDRNRIIAEFLAAVGSDVYCLQEFWLPQGEDSPQEGGKLVLEKYQEIMTSYDFVTKSRGGSKEDGVVVAYRRDLFEYVDREDVEFKGFFHHNRVGLVVHLRALPSGFPSLESPMNVFIATTHVLFPNWNLELGVQKEEVRLMCEAIEMVRSRSGADPKTTAVVFAGDFNAPNPRGRTEERRQPSRTLVPPVKEGAEEKSFLLHMLEKILRPFLTSAYAWYQVLEGFEYEASHVAVHGPKGNVVTHINHERQQVDCDFLFFKGEIEPIEAYLEPRHIPEDLLLNRPVIAKELDRTAADIDIVDAVKFPALWATISDHRPKTAVYKFAASHL